MTRWGWRLLAAVSGIAFALATPPVDLTPLVWLGLAGLAYALGAESRPPKDTPLARACAGGGRGLAFGIGVNVVALRFVPTVIARFTPLPWAVGVVALLLLACAQALAWWVAGVVRAQLVKRARLPRWLAFAVGVYAATFVPQIFPWTPAGVIGTWPTMLQLADAIGERGVSMLLAVSAGLVAEAARGLREKNREHATEIRRRSLISAVSAIALPHLMALYGASRAATIEDARAAAPTAQVALVQPSIGATERWESQNAPAILAKLTGLTRTAERRGAELTVWPESAYPYVLAHASRLAPMGPGSILQPGIRGPVLTGVVLSGDHGDAFNAAIVATSDGALSEPYDKLHLLWFGESVPLAAQLPWLRRTFARGIGMVPGERSVALPAGRIRAGVLICFEDILPEAGREAAATSPNLLVNVSNDAWFAGSQESELHLRLSVLRAIETRRDLVRAVNQGPTSWVDAAGIIRARYSAPLPSSLFTEPALLETPPTLYARLGDWPLVLLTVLGCILLRRVTGRRGAAEA